MYFLVLFIYCRVGNAAAFSLQHWFEVFNAKRRVSAQVSIEEFNAVMKAARIHPGTLSTFDNMKATFAKIADPQEWILDIMDSDPPKVKGTATAKGLWNLAKKLS